MAAKAKAKPKAKAKAKPVAKKKAAVKKTATAKKAAKATKAAKAQTTVTLRNLSDAIAEAHELPKKQANAMLTEMVEMIAGHLKKGSRIRIGGLGILQVRHRAARMGRNPATGEAIQIPAGYGVKVAAGSKLKNAAK